MKLAVLAKELLGLYFQNPIKDVMGSEIPFVLPLSNPSNGDKLGIDFKGFIDLVEKDDIIAEFKTSKQAMNQRDVDNHLQLTIYSFVYELIYQRPPKLLKIVNFVKTKQPKILVYNGCFG